MLQFHVDVKITTIGEGHIIHNASFDANDEHTHRLLFAIDPLAAAHFTEESLVKYDPTYQRQRKEAHP